MKRISIPLAAALLIGAPSVVQACGACVEDKIAATYDQVVIDAAIARHHQVVFVAVDGPVPPQAIESRVAAAAARVRGVQRGTLRTSAAPPAFSFSLDVARDPHTAVAAFRKALVGMNARLTLIRIIRDGALIEPSQGS